MVEESKLVVSVLLVEDSKAGRAWLRAAIDQSPDLTVVDEAEDGSTGIKKAMELRPDVVLMDIGLPDLSGIEATEQIKRAFPATRVVMVTVSENCDEFIAALDAGADGYCLKGCSAEQLCMAIRAVLVGEVWIDSRMAHLHRKGSGF